MNGGASISRRGAKALSSKFTTMAIAAPGPSQSLRHGRLLVHVQHVHETMKKQCHDGNRSETRYFATKKNKGNRNRTDSDLKKKKFFSSPTVYGTPETGLILPNKNIILDNEQPMPTSPSPSMQGANQAKLFPPMVDQGISVQKFDDALMVDPDSLSSSSVDKLNLSLSHEASSTPSMIDIASMYDPKIHLPLKPNFSDPSKNYEVATPLGDELMKYIGVLGAPITLAEYMKRCLRDENYGYYTNPPNDNDDFDDDDDLDDESSSSSEGRGHRLIGQAGDFTTAPEISQIFGECLTIWLLTQYEAIGKPSRIQLIELGPGRGTLMCDIIRSANGIKGPGEEFVNALRGGSSSNSSGDGNSNGNVNGSGSGNNEQAHGIHFVEVSDNLRITQREALQNLQQITQTDDDQSKSSSSDLNFNFVRWKTKDELTEEVQELMAKLREKKSKGETVDESTLEELLQEKRNSNVDSAGIDVDTSSDSQTGKTIPVHWHSNLDNIPTQNANANANDKTHIPTFIIGQEFLDALPVHVFQKSEHGWRERMVDVAIEEESDDDDKVEVEMRDGTKAVTSASTSTSTSTTDDGKKKPRFRHVLSPGITPALRNLLHIDENGNPLGSQAQQQQLNNAPIGTITEVCPEALALIQDIALRIEKCQGAALMIDYGNEGSRDSIRAFRRHEQVDVLSSPGTVDVTADVDFGALKNAVNSDLRAMLSKMSSDDGGDNNEHEHEHADVDLKNMPEAFGPQKQGQFLASMGAVERTIKLIEDDNTSDEQAEELCTALERLVSEEEMGDRFKVLAISKKKDSIFPPPGF